MRIKLIIYSIIIIMYIYYDVLSDIIIKFF